MSTNKEKLEQDSVTVGQLKELVERLNGYADDAELPFSFIVSYLFPDAYNRIMAYGQEQYTQGYIAGKATREN